MFIIISLCYCSYTETFWKLTLQRLTNSGCSTTKYSILFLGILLKCLHCISQENLFIQDPASISRSERFIPQLRINDISLKIHFRYISKHSKKLVAIAIDRLNLPMLTIGLQLTLKSRPAFWRTTFHHGGLQALGSKLRLPRILCVSTRFDPVLYERFSKYKLMDPLMLVLIDCQCSPLSHLIEAITSSEFYQLS